MLHDTPKYLNSAGVPEHQDASPYLGFALYDIAGSSLVQPTDDLVMQRFSVNRSFDLPSGLTDSYGESTTAALALTTYSIQKNGVEIGTMQWAASATVATFTLASTESFAIGDILSVVAPSTADTNHDGLSWTFAADLT